ncbi:LysR family transcriptional regulator [Burkholderia pseudomultivorans]|uniref:HTH-type transcriptional regulator PgrR n=1 Tax=Burkholderia pseudomultivorans TaxID=1207504 RepID=A0ABU2E8A2_9BURK|nr:LysR family transcriptional regulator [Burkholderia pseudomultivorans]MDR8730003.1 HTH-type transcriptional regulator PgrR [Burkholderia pseudomultivorans]MDR8735845.1 HTH-type transcriptional regulator PgrR [Burkholderia pseudomultivorans]MDR8744340.1 HTH-type transcriptional regulator PgrR [Burkholderia pseudomultivorans]MDR8756099.1 HTH-type transcriptional regulator PgrR [Burkholderia pseudomultivorans]MDR8781000.1 HTH-type transcriptional regulator PgrR [Burkholderia pseudomultivorans]
MNWDDARVFLAIHRERTLRRAAQTLGVDQATVGRRLATLEHQLGATPFLRSSKGYLPTPVGELALRAAEAMEQHAHELVRLTQGVDRRLAGDVKVTTTDALAIEFVMPSIARLHAKHPDVCVSLNTSTQVLNLAKREADIAVRTVRPANPDLVARRLACWDMGLFASPDYLLRHGEPTRGTAFAGHDLVVYQPYIDASRQPAIAGEPIGNARIAARINSSLMMRAALRAGLGIGEIPVYMGERDGLARVWPGQLRETPYEVWLVTHRDLRHTARIRATIDEIVFAFDAAR